MYPTPRTVLIRVGRAGSSSTFFRSLLIWTSSVFESAADSDPQTRRRIVVLGSTRPGFSSRSSSSWNCLSGSLTCSFLTTTSGRSGSRLTSPTREDVGRAAGGRERPAPQHGPDAGGQLPDALGPGQVVVGRALQALGRVEGGAVAGQDNDRGRRPLTYPLAQGTAGAAGKREIDQDELGVARTEHVERLVLRTCHAGIERLGPELLDHVLDEAVVVGDHQDARVGERS